MSTAENEDIKLFTQIMWGFFILICGIVICFAIYIGIDTPYYFYAVPVVATSVCVLILLREQRQREKTHGTPRTSNGIHLPLCILLYLPTGIGLEIISNMENLDFESIRQANIGVFNFIEGFLKYSWDDIATQGREESLQRYFAVIVYLFHSICAMAASIILLPAMIKLPLTVPQERIEFFQVLLLLVVSIVGIAMLADVFNSWNYYYRFDYPEYWKSYRYEFRRTSTMASIIMYISYYALALSFMYIAQSRDDTAGQETDRLP